VWKLRESYPIFRKYCLQKWMALLRASLAW